MEYTSKSRHHICGVSGVIIYIERSKSMYEFYVSVPNDENGVHNDVKMEYYESALALAVAGFQTTIVDTETKQSYLLSVYPIQTDNN